MNKVMTIEDAQTISTRCAKAIEIAGRVYVSFPFNTIDLADALITLNKALANAAKEVPRDEYNKLVRQITAMKARYIKLARKHNEKISEDDGE